MSGIEEAALRLKRALFFGHHHVVEEVLRDHARAAHADFGLEVALYDIEAVNARIEADPGIATRPVGPRSPILHLAFSHHIHGAGRQVDMIAVAEALRKAGADVNDAYEMQPGSGRAQSALYGSVGHADNMALARWLLSHGASPNDGESLYHACELGHLEALSLLLATGARPEGTNALARMLDFNNVDGVQLLLGAGADPNEGAKPSPSGETSHAIPALHQAARRMCSRDIGELLMAYGADGTVPFMGHSAFAFAKMMGNDAIAALLVEVEQDPKLDPVEEVFAAAAQGRVDGEIAALEMTPEQRRMLCRVVCYDDRLDHVKALVGIGVNPDWPEEMELPAIHLAGWEGQAEIVAYLLEFDPDLAAKNGYGGDLMGSVIHGAENCPARHRRDHIGCARHVLAAGASLHAADIEHCGLPAMQAFLKDWAKAHPDRVL